MADEFYLSYSKYQELFSGVHLGALEQAVRQIKEGKLYFVVDDGIKYRIVLDKSDKPRLEKA